jgi:hypothetical protein
VFEPRRVRLGYEGLQEVLIVDGLKANEQIVKDNSLLLAREFRNAEEQAKTHSPAAAPGAAAP